MDIRSREARSAKLSPYVRVEITIRPDVQLIPDRGQAAVDDQFFRSRAYLDLERATHTLLIESGTSRAALPLVVSRIPGSARRDASSPYGFPGSTIEGAPLDPGQVDLRSTGLVSVFIRDRVGAPAAFVGGTPRSMLQVSDPRRPRCLRPNDRRLIRRNKAKGYTTAMIAGRSALRADIEALAGLYGETMRNSRASERYLLDADYFAGFLDSPAAWLFLVNGPTGDAAAAAVVVRSDDLIHFHLSGTADAHRRSSPSKNLVDAIIDFGVELGLPVNLGGGRVPGDGLEEFKRRFSNARVPFRTHELICDSWSYNELSRDMRTEFFPAYRTLVAANGPNGGADPSHDFSRPPVLTARG